MFSPKWNMTKKEKLNYIKDTIEKIEVCNALEFCIQNKKNIESYKKNNNKLINLKLNINFWQMKLMKKKKIKTIYLISKIMIALRKINMKMKYRR